jgi:hypothetical protein
VAGSQLIVTVTRVEKKWTLTVSAAERGTWLTTYGVALVPNLNERAYLSKQSDSTFKVAEIGDEGGVVPIPSIMFHWLPTSAMLKDWSVGFTGGMGLAKERPAIFVGGSVAYNWNLVAFGGLAVAPHLVRRKEYAIDQILTENLNEEQLNQRQWKPSAVFGLTFRFGGNPFKASE